MENIDAKLKSKIELLLPHLNERQKRIYLSSEAENYGFGGVSKISRLIGVSRPTIIQGKKDQKQKPIDLPRSRKEGGGRKKIYEKYPELMEILENMIEPLTIGDPMSCLRWTVKSTRNLADELKKMGYQASHVVVADMLKLLEYSLQANIKTIEGSDHPDRNEQFEYIHKMSEKYVEEKNPVISVDTKKKELVGNYKNNGVVLSKLKSPNKVGAHDFGKEKAVPFGIFDNVQNRGFVNVGTNYDTSAFAVESIRRWWYDMGKMQYPESKKLLIIADGGGSNGSRRRLWKTELQKLATETQLEITVCHLPPGTSKWNKIEHRLFSHITMNWQGVPLESYETIVNLIGGTKTRKGLKVSAVLDENIYQKGIIITDEEMKGLHLKSHKFHGDWNYTFFP